MLKLKYTSSLSFSKNNHFYFQITIILKIIKLKNISEELKLSNDDINILKREMEMKIKLEKMQK